jgi:hypothetical protein
VNVRKGNNICNSEVVSGNIGIVLQVLIQSLCIRVLVSKSNAEIY